MHPHDARDGLGGYAWGLTPFVIRTWDLGKRVASNDWRRITDTPLLTVLGTHGDTVLDWLHAGQALARVLLLACANDLSASFFNQPIEVPTLRPKVCAVIERNGFAQMIVGLGYGRAAHPTLRRMVIDVLN